MAVETEDLPQEFSEIEPLDEESADFVARIVDACMQFMDVLVGHSLRPYQVPFARRIFESLVIEDADTITALFSRQSGKSETVCNTVAVAMILFPRLAKIFPERMGKFKNGLMVGIFAPVEGQAETLFGRLVDRLTSEQATDVLQDPEIDDAVEGKARRVRLKKCGSYALMMTANPRAKIESKTFHLILLDEAQDCFPGETPVLTDQGWVPIREIGEGSRRDWVVAAQDCDGNVGWSSVRTAFRTPRYAALVRVDHERGSLYCTANHPLVVGDARVPARDLRPGAALSVVSRADQPTGPTASSAGYDYRLQPDVLVGAGSALAGGAGAIQSARGMARAVTNWDSQPQGLRAHALAQSDEGFVISGEDVRQFASHRPQAFPSGWEREGLDRTAAAALGVAGERLGSRVCLPRWTADEGRSSDPLQSGSVQSESLDGDRVGWEFSPGALAPGAGRAEDFVVRESRVLGVEVLEPGSAEFSQFSNGADWVYTLGVEAESSTFVAGGIMVGNCDDYVVMKSIHPMGAAVAATIVKTGTPTTRKGNFYQEIQNNKRRQLATRNGRQCHFEADWREVAKWNPAYKKSVLKDMERMGEDSDEFQMSYCSSPETRILTADLRHVRADSIKVGDRLVGFDEERPGKGMHRRLKETVVEDVARITRPCYRIYFDDGTEITVSEEHQWLVTTAGRRTVWKATKDITPQDGFFKVCGVWESPRDYTHGYLAGAYDGEGCLSYVYNNPTVSISQRDNRLLAQVRDGLSELGFAVWERNTLNGTNADVHNISIGGGRAEVMRFLGQIRPERLLAKLDLDRLGTVGRHDRDGYTQPRVIDMVFLGDQEVVAIRTSTRTYIAEGLASHNCLKWLLERGMFTTSTRLDELGDTSMQELVKAYHRTPVVVGIDPARTMDSTVVTVLFVDWDRPDEFGFFNHRVLNWLELTGMDWEEQYFQIQQFLDPYNIRYVGVDAQGVGDAVAQRLAIILRSKGCEVVPVKSNLQDQSKRWKHLMTLMDRGLIGWPAGAKVRRLRTWKRFYQQMQDAEKIFTGPNIVVRAPDEAHAHDDFVDSLAIAAFMTLEESVPTVEVISSPFFR